MHHQSIGILEKLVISLVILDTPQNSRGVLIELPHSANRDSQIRVDDPPSAAFRRLIGGLPLGCPTIGCCQGRSQPKLGIGSSDLVTGREIRLPVGNRRSRPPPGN
jgi:hypothetical protein